MYNPTDAHNSNKYAYKHTPVLFSLWQDTQHGVRIKKSQQGRQKCFAYEVKIGQPQMRQSQQNEIPEKGSFINASSNS